MVVSNTWIKLIDFGMAKRLNVDDIGFSTSTSTMVGTVSIKIIFFFFSNFFFDKSKIPFMAPEVRNFQSYNCKADIFSIGALIVNLIKILLDNFKQI